MQQQNEAIEQISQAIKAENANIEAKQGRTIVNEAVITINTLAEEVQQTAAVVNQLNTCTHNVNDILDKFTGP
ncbi:hypothetical protein ACRN9C_07065 [Shewanella frigidimarina]|uniref:hypothetical protein n=1 Tax=Shewanella frigidimarina TaxID=56812 RepID=UPI003D7A4115